MNISCVLAENLETPKHVGETGVGCYTGQVVTFNFNWQFRWQHLFVAMLMSVASRGTPSVCVLWAPREDCAFKVTFLIFVLKRNFISVILILSSIVNVKLSVPIVSIVYSHATCLFIA